MRAPPKRTVKLPHQLLDELGVQDATTIDRGRSKRPAAPRSTRKELRKAERERKKLNNPRSRSEIPHTRSPRLAPKSQTSGERRPSRRTTETKPGLSESLEADAAPRPLLHRSGAAATTSASDEARLKPSRAVRDRLEQDDADIAALERKLGIKGKKRRAAGVDEAGLDGLLDGLGVDEHSSGSDDSGSSAKKRRHEAAEWLANKRRKAGHGSEAGIDRGADFDGGKSASELGDFDNSGLDSASEGQDTDVVDDDDDDGDLDERSVDAEERPAKRVRENPYVAPVTGTERPAPVKYTPPSRRSISSAESGDLARLRRRLQGLLNRLSEANLIAILDEVEAIYRVEARQHVTVSLTDLLFGLIGERASLQDAFLILHAAFIAAVNKVIGVDFGAAVIQRAIEEVDLLGDELADAPTKTGAESGKARTLTNIISLLAALYSFQVVGSKLIFDLIRLFLDELSEIKTELLLKMMRNAGAQLRQDDPSAIKDVVLMLQPAVAKMGEAQLSARMKFMIETIHDLKNNRIRTGLAASSISAEATMRMKKLIGSLNTRSLRASEPLRVGLQDLRDGERRGKWWLVGAGWSDEGQRARAEETRIDDGPAATGDDDGETADLGQLAREQRMNTDIRRAIFVTVMSASDYRDAHLRLTKLGLKRSQELEVPRVLVHCSGAEQAYNPYYTLIARRLCADHKLKMAFQFSLWDLFKSLDGEQDAEDEGTAMDMRKMVNLAKLFGSLIGQGVLGIGVLKHLTLTYLPRQTKTFVELLLITVLLQSQVASPGAREATRVQEIFAPATDNVPLARGLAWFLRKVIRRTDLAGTKGEKATVLWASSVARDALTGEGS